MSANQGRVFVEEEGDAAAGGVKGFQANNAQVGGLGGE